MELNNTMHKSFIHSVFTIITVTYVGGMDLGPSISQLALLELLLNCLNSVSGCIEAFKDEEDMKEKRKKNKIINK